MSYTPTEWKSGDVVTSAKLNKLEEGVASSGGALIATLSETYSEEAQDYVKGCDKTLEELETAMKTGGLVVFRFATEITEEMLNVTYYWATQVYDNNTGTAHFVGIGMTRSPRDSVITIEKLHVAFYDDGTVGYETEPLS